MGAPADWDPADNGVIPENHTLKTRRFSLKLAYGSGYIYAKDHPPAPAEPVDFPVLSSLALGGFSNVWAGRYYPTGMMTSPIGRYASATSTPTTKRLWLICHFLPKRTPWTRFSHARRPN